MHLRPCRPSSLLFESPPFVVNTVVVVVLVVVDVVGLKAKSIVQFVIRVLCFFIYFFLCLLGDGSFCSIFLLLRVFIRRCRCQHGCASTLGANRMASVYPTLLFFYFRLFFSFAIFPFRWKLFFAQVNF